MKKFIMLGSIFALMFSGLVASDTKCKQKERRGGMRKQKIEAAKAAINDVSDPATKLALEKILDIISPCKVKKTDKKGFCKEHRLGKTCECTTCKDNHGKGECSCIQCKESKCKCTKCKTPKNKRAQKVKKTKIAPEAGATK